MFSALSDEISGACRSCSNTVLLVRSSPPSILMTHYIPGEVKMGAEDGNHQERG